MIGRVHSKGCDQLLSLPPRKFVRQQPHAHGGICRQTGKLCVHLTAPHPNTLPSKSPCPPLLQHSPPQPSPCNAYTLSSIILLPAFQTQPFPLPPSLASPKHSQTALARPPSPRPSQALTGRLCGTPQTPPLARDPAPPPCCTPPGSPPPPPPPWHTPPAASHPPPPAAAPTATGRARPS